MNRSSKLKIEEKRITNLSETKEVVFEFPIKQVLEFENGILIRLEPDINKIFNENVFCLSFTPKIIWQIEPVKKLDNDSPYTNIVIKNGKLFLYSWSGEEMEVNIKSGIVISKIFRK